MTRLPFLLLMLTIAIACWPSGASGDETADASDASLPMHALEVQALRDPERVLKVLPARLAEARRERQWQELAALYLAQANACRVVANWPCQRVAGAEARLAAQSADVPLLVVRSLIAESRALIAMQDFSRGEELLGQAEVVLRKHASPVLSADVMLAYSSLSFALGKHGLSAEYAARGLAVLRVGEGLPMQARLLRNLARAQALLGQIREADSSLLHARQLAERVGDPKLSAELLLGAARMARMAGDAEGQVRSGERVLALAGQLKNSQLEGMGHEVIGLAALTRGEPRSASVELTRAYESFRKLGLKRDELRVLRELIGVAVGQGEPRSVIDPMVTRFLSIDTEIEQSDRAKAADDFDARLRYAEREMDVLRLKDEAALAAERERVLAASNRQSRSLVLFTVALLVVLTAFFIMQRRSNARLRDTLALLRESEARAHDLLNLSSGFVFLHDVEGRLVLVNPAAAQALGHAAGDLVGRLLQDFQPRASRDAFSDYLQRVQVEGGDEGVFLVRSGHGDHRHWRYSSRLSAPEDGRAYVVGNAVDITDQVLQTRALHEQNVRDALTGVYNRRHLQTFEAGHGADRPWATLTVDLDHFKQVNDTRGHDRGDQVLIEFAQFLSARVREADSVVRLGGDEFVLLLAGAGAELVEATLARLQRDASQAPCAFSVGSAQREGDEALNASIARADAAMYAARAAARQRADAAQFGSS